MKNKYNHLNKIYALCEVKEAPKTECKVLYFPPHVWSQWGKTLRAIVAMNKLRIRQNFSMRHFWNKNKSEMREMTRALIGNTREAEKKLDELARYIVKYALREDGVMH